jgi:hypothetical protein
MKNSHERMNEPLPAQWLSRSYGAADCTVTRDVNVNGGVLSQSAVGLMDVLLDG